MKNLNKSATKVYSEDDLRKAIIDAVYTIDPMLIGTPEFEKEQDRVIKSLKQSKTPKWFVAELAYNGETLAAASGFSLKTDPILKTTIINGKTYLVGKYLFD